MSLRFPGTHLECDFSRMDRHVRVGIREVEFEFLDWVHRTWFYDWESTHESIEFMRHSRFNHVEGIKYNHVCQRYSGEDGTSFWNTLLVMSWVRMVDESTDFVADGDDSVIFDCGLQDRLESLAGNLGLSIKCSRKTYGVDLTFLSRIYYDGMSSTILSRALHSAHFCASSHCDPVLVCRGKCLSLLYTDYHTPVISAYYWAVLRLLGAGKWVLPHDHFYKVMVTKVDLGVYLHRPPPPFNDRAATILSEECSIPTADLRTLHDQLVNCGSKLKKDIGSSLCLINFSQPFSSICHVEGQKVPVVA